MFDQTFKDRAFEDSQDNVHVNFYFGPNPSVPKRTRVVLPLRLNAEFQRVPHQWDARVISQEKNTLSVEVSKQNFMNSVCVINDIFINNKDDSDGNVLFEQPFSILNSFQTLLYNFLQEITVDIK